MVLAEIGARHLPQANVFVPRLEDVELAEENASIGVLSYDGQQHVVTICHDRPPRVFECHTHRL